MYETPGASELSGYQTRTLRKPAISFTQWLVVYGDIKQTATEYDYANVIGGLYAETTKAGRGKLKGAIQRINYTNQALAKYHEEVRSGRIPMVEETIPLGDSEADQAYRRARAKRAAAKGRINNQ